MLQRVLISEGDEIETPVLRAAKWFGLMTGGLSDGQERRLRAVARMSKRRIAREMLMRRADATLWFKDEPCPALPRHSRKHPLLLLDVRRPLEAEVVARWLEANQVETLHVTGRRQGFDFIYSYLPNVFRAAGLRLFSDAGGRFSGSVAVIDRDRVWAISAWPKLDCFLRISNCWQHRRGSIGLAIQALSNRAEDPIVRSFLQGIPTEARDVLFGFRDGHRRFVRLFGAFERELADLVRGRAWMLVYMLCYTDCFTAVAKLDQDDMRELFTWKQRSIWALYGAPDSESFARTMRKIPPECCSIPMFHAMRAAFATENAMVDLNHLPRINLGAAQVAVHHLATTSLVREVSRQPSEDVAVNGRVSRIARLLDHIVEEAGERHVEAQLRPVHSIAQANRLMLHLLRVAHPVRHIPQASGWIEQTIPFDPPVIPAVIQQLTSSESLKVEGNAMDHCVRSYFQRVAARKSLIFRVLPGSLPDITRATLELVSGGPLRNWDLRQLKAKGNGPVSDATKLLVETWLRLVNANPQIASAELESACLSAIAPPARCAA